MSNKIQMFSFQYRVAPKIPNSRPLPLSNPHAIIKFDFETRKKPENDNKKVESSDFYRPCFTIQKPDL